MRTLHHRLSGEPVYIHFYEGTQDYDRFMDWLDEPRTILGIDTETTGLDIYARDFAPRLVQFGDERTAWVIPARHAQVIRDAIRRTPLLCAHNAPHELHTLDRHFDITLEELHPKLVDTYILAHILDPRGPEDGGIGHGLKDLAVEHVDPLAADGDKALKEVFKAMKWTGDTGWREIPEDHEDFVRYSGLDPIITVRLFNVLWPQAQAYQELVSFEHKLQRLLAKMERRGILLDVGYTQKLETELDDIVTANEAQLIEMFKNLGTAKLTPRGQRLAHDAVIWGLGGIPPKRRKSTGKLYENMTAGSNQVVVASLLAMGEKLTQITATGNLAVDKDVLNELCDVNKDDERLELREPNPLARLVKDAKRAGKWKESYVSMMLSIMDSENRVHPKISGLRARTARMAISRPPFQQLPSSGAMIRDCLIADPGHQMIACDYDQIEMRVIAAIAKEKKMLGAIKRGEDIHDFTATILYGPGFTNKQRKAAKNAGFGKVYGGGARTLAKQVGVTESQAKEVISSYDEAFPGIKDYSQWLQGEAYDNDCAITTPIFGRRLPVDERRLYAATNYMVQSTSRDIFAQALLDLDKAGLGQYLLLPVHDEIIAQAPKAEAAEVAKAIGQTMTTNFMGVELSAKGEIVGARWGDAYK